MTDDADLSRALHRIYAERETELKEKYARSLPFQDGFFDRWERARRLGFGDKASIYNSALVFGEVEVGENTWIGPYVILDGSAGGLQIGAWCSISAGVHIYTHDTVAWALSGGVAPKRTGPVRIGDCCHLGSQSVIRAGVRIGARCVVAANSFVNRDVADGTIVGGTPAVPIGRVVGRGAAVELSFD